MDFLLNNLMLVIPPAIIVAFGLAICFKDVLRLSWTRIWAISGVCFQESIRRRVLWVIPLAIVGVLGVSAFQKAVDQQDAIRQIIQFSLFATGMLLVVTLIILACTNLPREIENRVIFTIVTKPTSRLEIVIGKVVGFSRVSALVLVIMGLFTSAYVGVQSLRMHAAIDERLRQPDLAPGERISLEYYRDFGLLSAKKLVRPVSNDVLADLPDASGTRWIGDFQDGDVVVPFFFDPAARAKLDLILATENSDPNQPVLVARVHALQRAAPGAAGAATTTRASVSPLINPSSTSATLQIFSPMGDMVADSATLHGSASIPDDGAPFEVAIPRPLVDKLGGLGAFNLSINCATPGRQIGFGDRVAELVIESADRKTVLAEIPGLTDRIHPQRQRAQFRGHQGRGGQQVRGDPQGHGTLALLEYRNTGFAADQGPVSMEIRTNVERGASEADETVDLTKMDLTFYNRSRPDAAPVTLTCFPENSRTFFLSVPGAAVAGGDFDIVVRCTTSGNWFSAEIPSFAFVASTQPFAWNLAKSLFVMWLMSLLVIIASVFTSTFVSWPIAVVLTLLILLGRWGVLQLGDALEPGIGNQISTQFQFKDPTITTTVSKSVEALSGLLRNLANVLPDISTFAASEDIQRGMQLQPAVLVASGLTLLIFGLPMLVLAYVFLRYKEVAP